MEAVPVYPETRPECFGVPAAVVPAFSVCRYAVTTPQMACITFLALGGIGIP